MDNPNKARERLPLIKSKGVTSTEKYLHKLCENTFLSLWSYSNIFRKQKTGGKGDGKELCDMLVVCGDDIIIFSDKYCEFPDSGDLELDWERWFNRAIKKSVDQVWGAERWLKYFPNEIFIDRKCTNKFPLEIPNSEKVKFHLIVVANGCEDRCQNHFGGSSSLLINTGINFNDSSQLVPFLIGDLDRQKTFVHILTKSTLDILLTTLDTITDFVWYLNRKETFLRKMNFLVVPGEEELLAFYLKNVNENNEHDFVLKKDVNAFFLEEGFWDEFDNSEERKQQIKANELSYSWDNLINLFSKHILDATQYYTNSIDLADSEKGLRFMARETRLARRMIMEGFYEMLKKETPVGTKRAKYLLPSNSLSPYYIFISLQKPDELSYEEYREVRGNLLLASMKVLKLKFPKANDIVGIASEPLGVDISSEDLIYLDAREWTKEMDEEAFELQKKLNILNEVKIEKSSVKEYPLIKK